MTSTQRKLPQCGVWGEGGETAGSLDICGTVIKSDGIFSACM